MGERGCLGLGCRKGEWGDWRTDGSYVLMLSIAFERVPSLFKKHNF